MFIFFQKKQKEPENLNELLKRFKNLEEDFKKIFQELENLKKESKFSFQKFGIVRYNPFFEGGGDQSFSLALLDGKGDGMVITSLFSRQENRVYGKPIKEGKSSYPLSEEEKEAIKRAIAPYDKK